MNEISASGHIVEVADKLLLFLHSEIESIAKSGIVV